MKSLANTEKFPAGVSKKVNAEMWCLSKTNTWEKKKVLYWDGECFLVDRNCWYDHACEVETETVKPDQVGVFTPDKALAAASKRFMPKMTVEEILEPREKFSILFTEALNSFPDKKQGECPNVFSARYASFVNYVLAVQATRIADFMHGAE